MIKIINSDWRDAMNTIDDSSVDLLITDPPYGMNFVSNYRKKKYAKIKDDDSLHWLDEWSTEISRVLKSDAHAYVFCSWHHIDNFKIAIEKKLKIKNILVWKKNNWGMGDLKGDYAPMHEFVFFINGNGKKKLNGSRVPNVIEAKRTGNKLHPTQKPETLIDLFIDKSSKAGDLILDTFGGSGTTAFCAKRKNRSCISIEIDADYIEVTNKRLAALDYMLF